MGQRALGEQELWELISSRRRLARELFGRSRHAALRRLLRGWQAAGRWPVVMSARRSHFTPVLDEA